MSPYEITRFEWDGFWIKVIVTGPPKKAGEPDEVLEIKMSASDFVKFSKEK